MDESGGVVADGDGFGRLDGIDTWTERKVNVEVRVRRSLNRNCVGLFCRTCSAKGEREKLVCEVKLEGKREERTHIGRKERDLETWREKARDSSRRGIRHVAPLYSVFAILKLNRGRFWERRGY